MFASLLPHLIVSEGSAKETQNKATSPSLRLFTRHRFTPTLDHPSSQRLNCIGNLKFKKNFSSTQRLAYVDLP